MASTALKAGRPGNSQEAARLEALRATGILDTPREPGYDAITRLAGEYFNADWAGISFADETRIWIKSSWGQQMRELPRCNSIFDMVLAQDGPVVIEDISKLPELDGLLLSLRVLSASSVASVPIRSSEGQILGLLILYRHEPRPVPNPDEIAMLEGLAEMVARDLERRRLKCCEAKLPEIGRPHLTASPNSDHRPHPSDLRRALDQNQFVLFYQPEIDLRTREIVGVEALIRWEHPVLGLLPPKDFIPLAEESGLILPIGDWVVAEACSQIQLWKADGKCPDALRVCVNLSARQFSREGLADHISASLLHAGVPAHHLGLEMTESSLVSNTTTAMTVLSGLHELGVSLLLDDFGTGYSSLNYLHRFPFDVLKLDRSFVVRMTEGNQPLQIVRAITELARALGMDMIAEGIETQDQYRALRNLGCQFGQGFLFAKPMRADAVVRLLQRPGTCEV